VVVKHVSSLRMVEEEEGLSGDLTGRSSGWQSDGCNQMARSGGGDDLSSGETKFLRKRNSKECGEWMRRRIRMLPMPFYRAEEGGETVSWRRNDR
jgi:hypothetical protein